MDSSENVRRRTVLELAAVSGIGGFLAGCLGNDGYDEEVYEDETLVDDEPEYGGFLADVDYPGTVDWTGERKNDSGADGDSEAVTVLVGSGSGVHFGPAAIRIDRGTTVRWEWTGDGGPHDVVHTDGAFESGQTHREGHTFEHAFDETGTYTYICRPHETQGMKGVVDVV